MALVKPRLSPSIISTQRKVPQFAMANCVKTHANGGFVQLFVVNDSVNQRHSGCPVTLRNVPWERRRLRLPVLRERPYSGASRRRRLRSQQEEKMMKDRDRMKILIAYDGSECAESAI